MQHLALATHDLAASSAFYRDYFGFRAERGEAFLVDPEGFVLTLEAIERPAAPPAWLHFGFHLATRDAVLALAERMRGAGVVIADGPKQQGASTVFFCVDPGGCLVEVRAST